MCANRQQAKGDPYNIHWYRISYSFPLQSSSFTYRTWSIFRGFIQTLLNTTTASCILSVRSRSPIATSSTRTLGRDPGREEFCCRSGGNRDSTRSHKWLRQLLFLAHVESSWQISSNLVVSLKWLTRVTRLWHRSLDASVRAAHCNWNTDN